MSRQIYESRPTDPEGRPPQNDPNIILPIGATADIDGRAVDDDTTDETPKKKSQATMLVELVDAHAGLELFHAPDHKPFAYIPVTDHFETLPLRSRAFRRWAAGLFFEKCGTTPGSQAVQDALAVLEARALFDGSEIPVHVRIAKYFDDIFLDLGCDEWHQVQITAEGWKVVGGSPVRFRRPSGMQPLPHPDRDGSIEDLRDFVNVKPADWSLLLATTIAMLNPDIPYPVADLLGEQGSAKTTTTRVVRSLVDPNAAPVRTSPRSERDLMVAATSSWVTVIDNLSTIPDWMSDAIARLSTGGGMAVRELYTDDEPFLFDARRPVIMNGITEVVSRPDLLDRCVIFEIPRLNEHRNEADLWNAFEEVRAGILGVLLDAVAFGLKNLATVQKHGLPRMADFARWAMACAPMLGIRPDEFLEAYIANRKAANTLALDASPIAATLITFMSERDRWTGTATELLAELNAIASEVALRDRSWPTSARKLSGDLRRIAPNLRRAGVEVTPPLPGDKTRTWTLEQSPIEPPEPPNRPNTSADQHQRTGGISGGMGDLELQPPEPPEDRPTKRAGQGGMGGIGGLSQLCSKDVVEGSVCPGWCVRGQRYGKDHEGTHISDWNGTEDS